MESDTLHRRRSELGPLEASVMDALWESATPLDVESVHARVARSGRPVRNTVQSTLERLVRKGLVERDKYGRAYRYAARIERRDWFAGAVSALADVLRSRTSTDVLAGFVDFAERTDPDALQALQRMIDERLGGGSAPPSRGDEEEDGGPAR